MCMSAKLYNIVILILQNLVFFSGNNVNEKLYE